MQRIRTLAMTGAMALAAGVLVTITGPPAVAASSPRTTVLYAAPNGSGERCDQQDPCSLSGAQRAVRVSLAGGKVGGGRAGGGKAGDRRATDGKAGGGIKVLVGDGTYRLGSGLQFGPADSGRPGDPVVWQAAPGAHPVISGGTRVTGWTESDPSAGIWSAKVPTGSATRQVYVNGQSAPVAQASVSSLGLSLQGWGSTGFTTSGTTATWFSDLASRIGPADVTGVQLEFNPMSPTDWEESSCPVASIGSGTITMAQPCWNNLTDKTPTIWGGNNSNITPYSLSPGSAPTTVENAYSLLHPGQWYLDQPTSTLYYQPTAGQQMADLDIELPRVQSLMQVSGTLTTPVHDLSFSGLTFTTATWLQPSTDVGFAQVQDNLNVTKAPNQGECSYAVGAAGSCPWGAFSQPLANIQLTAADRVTFEGDTFTDLGGVGLGAEYGSDDNLIQGSTFTQIASSAIWLGCSGDPNPTDPVTDPPSAVIADCSAGPASVHDRIGANEIMTGNTVDDNVIYGDAAGYDGAAGVTLLFTRHTTISHNDMFDMPYDAITSGAWQGHPDGASWTNTTNINGHNAITDNLFHNNMQSFGDGGDIYTEGNQGATVHNADGSINTSASYAEGTTISGNVTDTDTTHTSYAVAPDVGSQWISLTGNVEWNSHYSMSSHWPTDAAPYTRSYQNWYADPDDTPSSPGEYDNTQIPETPGPADLPLGVLADAGVQGSYQALEAAVPTGVYYSGASAASGSSPAQVLISGTGFTRSTAVFIGGVSAPHVRFVSSGFLVADVPAGANGTGVTIGSAGLAATYDNIGITADGATGAGDFDGDDYSYSETALTNAGAAPGAAITTGGITYTIPDVPAGTDGNTVAEGQTVAVSGSATDLGFLLSAGGGQATGTGTITYTDGTTQSYTLTAPDWLSTTPPTGGTVAVSSAYRNAPGNTTQSATTHLFAETVPIDPAKTLATITLPAGPAPSPSGASLHIFALGLTAPSGP